MPAGPSPVTANADD